MKRELSFLERGYYANQLRKRSSHLRTLADVRTLSGTKQELLAEAEWCESQALALDDADEPTAVSETTPIKANGRGDIDYIDAVRRADEGGE